MPIAGILRRITAFCAGHYNVLQGTPRHSLALAYSAILALARELPTSSADPDLAKACKEVLEHTRT